MSIKLILTFILTLIALAVQAQEIDYKGFPQWSWQKRDSTEYYLYTPSNMKKGARYPVVLALHGCCGQDYKATLRNAVDPIVRVWHNFGENKQDIPTYIIAPKTRRGWMQHAENLKAAIDDLVTNHQADPQRIYITGFSMGGDGTWKMLEKYPDLFAAAIPMGANYNPKAPEKIRHIPVWTIRGGKDWWARYLGREVANLRGLNNGPSDSSTMITGVNPRFTTFEDLGHVVMWEAASSLDLRSWMYSKINDGNKYPFIYLERTHKSDTLDATPGTTIKLLAEAYDEDGSIAHVSFFHNDRLIKTVSNKPYSIEWKVTPGTSVLSAIAQDDKGKTSEAAMIVSTNEPVAFKKAKLPSGTSARPYTHPVSASGNEPISYSIVSGQLPAGISLSGNGTLTGFPTKDGSYSFTIGATDRDGDRAEQKFDLRIGKKEAGDVLITNVRDYRNNPLPLATLTTGALPFHDRTDGEINISRVPDNLDGLTFIQTAFNDTTDASPHYVTFTVDMPVTVYVAYERKDNLFKSTTPEWLSDFKKTDDQLVAQYFYYDIYGKDLPAGLVAIPDASEKANGVSTNYFVIIKPKLVSRP